MTEHIGFIGVGTMGAALAGRLLGAGYRLTIFDLNKKTVADFVNSLDLMSTKRSGTIFCIE